MMAPPAPSHSCTVFKYVSRFPSHPPACGFRMLMSSSSSTPYECTTLPSYRNCNRTVVSINWAVGECGRERERARAREREKASEREREGEGERERVQIEAAAWLRWPPLPPINEPPSSSRFKSLRDTTHQSEVVYEISNCRKTFVCLCCHHACGTSKSVYRK